MGKAADSRIISRIRHGADQGYGGGAKLMETKEKELKAAEAGLEKAEAGLECIRQEISSIYRGAA